MTTQGKAPTYRPEIDGLRAIAVLSVLVYHLKIPLAGGKLLPGGFLGVDLFFVLSGFLITQILLNEFAATGRISIAQFYIRRSRRILPPLLLVILCAMPAAWMILLPGELERFAWSVLGGLFFVSNIFWFFELSEYGAQSGLLQPFLHTWSLAIEEQFYLVFPPLLWLLLRRWGPRVALACVMALLVLGLGAAQGLTHVHPDLSFYSPSSRAWELLAGSAMAMLAQRSPMALKGPLTNGLAPPLALAVLLGCFAALNLAQIAHPGLVTLPVILATCALIWFADPANPVTRLLSLPPMLWVGRLSYSLYLWHFPVFAFGRLLAIGEPGPGQMALWLVITFGLSLAGHHLVEKPFRFRLSLRPFALATGTATLGVVAACALVLADAISNNGQQGDLKALYGPAAIDNEALGLATWGPLDSLRADEDIGPWNALRPSNHEVNDLWFTEAQARKVLIIGDSHAKDVYNALTLNAAAFPDTGFARFNLHRKTLAQDLALLVASPNFAAADTILVAPRYYREYRESLAQVLAAVNGQGKAVIVLGNTAEFDAGGALPLFDWYLRKSGTAEALAGLNAVAPKYETPGAAEVEADIARIAAEAGAGFLSRRALMCQDGGCTLVTPDGQKTMYDDTHWTLEGAALFGARAAMNGWLKD